MTGPRTSDAVADLCFLVGFLTSLSVAAFRRPGQNTRIADTILTFSFYTLLVGTMVFTWANMRKFVAIALTMVVVLLAMAYLIVKDPSSGKHMRPFSDRGLLKRKIQKVTLI